MIAELTDENFAEEIGEGKSPCIISFTANWCTFCKDMRERLEELAPEYVGRLKFYSCNIDENRALRIKFAVAGLPYIIYIANAEISPLFDAIAPTSTIRERLDYALSGSPIPGTRPLY